MFRINRLLLICACTAVPALSYATLGGDMTTIDADNKALASSVSTVVTTTNSDSSYKVSTIKTPDDITINEYSSLGGQVFCVTWHGSKYPNFIQIYGNDATQLKSAKSSGQSVTSNNLLGNDFVSKISGLPHRLSGMAYKPSLVPNNVNVNRLK